MNKILSATLTLLTAATLAACTQTPLQPAAPKPNAVLGAVRVSFQLGSQTLTSSATPAARATTQALTGIGAGGIQMRLLSTSTFTTGTRGSGGERWLSATYDIRNASMTSGNAAYTSANSNVTFVATGTSGLLGDSAIADMQSYGGTSITDAALAQSFKPSHGTRFNAVTGAPEINPGAEDFQAFDETEVQGFATGSLIPLTYGFVVRRSSANPTNRTLAANPAANQFDGRVTFAVRLPLQATISDDPFTFAMNFLVVTDDQTRVTQSLEQQASNTVPPQATQLTGTVVNTLPGSAYNTGVTRALPSVRIAKAPTNSPVYLVQAPTSINVSSNADSGSGTLRQALLDIAPSGTIDLIEIDGQAITLLSTLVLSKNLTIVSTGNQQGVTVRGGVTAYAPGNVRLFQVQSGVTASIVNVVLRNGYASGSPARGGAIFNAGTLTLQNSNLSNNMVRGDDGVAGVDGGIIEGMTRRSPTRGGAGEMAQGGAVYNAGTLSIVSVGILNNQAVGGDGGQGGDSMPCFSPPPCVGIVPESGGHGGSATGGAVFNETTATLSVIQANVEFNAAKGGDGGSVGNITPEGFTGGSGGNGGNAVGGAFAIASNSAIPDLVNVNFGIGNSANTVTAGAGIAPGGTNGAATNPNKNF